MATISQNNDLLNFDVSYVKYIKVNDMMEFYSHLLSGSITIKENSDNLLDIADIITPFSRTKDILNFKKTSLLGKYLMSMHDENEIIFNDKFIEK
jgi:outer membrane phospholipase A